MSPIEAFTASLVPESPSVWKQVLSLCGLGYSVISWLTRCYCLLQKSAATSLNTGRISNIQIQDWDLEK